MIKALKNPVMGKGKYIQHRVLADYSAKAKLGHVTVAFGKEDMTRDFSDLRDTVMGEEVTYLAGKKTITVIVVKHERFGEKLNMHSHITVKPGKHKPWEMGLFTKQYNAGVPEIEIGGEKYPRKDCASNQLKLLSSEVLHLNISLILMKCLEKNIDFFYL